MSTSLIDKLNDVVPGGTYLITGDKINLYNALLRALWAGHNLNTLGAGIRKKQNGAAGVSLFTDGVSDSETETTPHDYTVVDVSSGSVAMVSVTPGVHQDSTNGGLSTIIPTINSVPINTQTGIPPQPPQYPALAVADGNTCIAFVITVVATDGSGTDPTVAPGSIVSIAIQSYATLPMATTTRIYQVVQGIQVNISASGNRSVTNLGGGVSGSQAYQFCGGAQTGLI
jgi:hypothetical protein